jgi:4-hydroxy-tetrahydrodipicolinate synthase
MPRFSTPHVIDGCTVPLVTPLGPDRRPDARAVLPLLDALAAAGVLTIMLMGTNGEGATLDIEDAAAFSAETAAAWRARLGARAKVFVTAFGAGTAQALKVSTALLRARPDALVYAPPHYFIHTEDELADHFLAAGDLGVPVIAYNIPRYSNNPITPRLLERIAAMEHVVGIKDSGGADSLTEQAIAIQNALPRFGVSQGNEKRLGWALMAGARGITPGLSNLSPRLCAEIVAAAMRDDAGEVDRLQERLTGLVAIHSFRPGVAAMKAALSLIGLCPKTPGAPFRAYEADELVRLRAILAPFDGDLAAPLAKEAAA